MLRKLFYKYQELMWFVAQAGGEIGKPLRFVPETLMVLTFITVNFDIKFGVVQVLGLYAGILVLAMIIGKLLLDWGVLRYVTKLNNNHNPELMEILERIRKLEENGKH